MKHTPTLAAACIAIAGFAWLTTVQAAPVIYPAKSQSASQTDQDKLACFEWSRSQSGFDPMHAFPAPAPAAAPPTANNNSNGSNPTGSMARGAAGGAALAELTQNDAGKGAAVGVLGAAMRDHMRQQQQQQAKQQQAAQQQQQRAQQQAASTQQRATFERAFGACMEGRGYVVK
jgi:predicted lipid-binding transport protein (Tim44 family)